VFLTLWLSGCAALRGPGALPALEPGGFELRGKLGVSDAAESFSARFLWRQQGPDFNIDLWGPFGQGRVQLIGDERELTLLDGDGAVITRGPHETVMRRNLGWSLPLRVLPAWVQGRPDAHWPAREEIRDDAGHLTAFSQLDWEVQLERFARPDGVSTDRELPYRVTAQRGPYRVRLAISEWRI
jgi:outer membrane lipoprotein LolB